MNEPDYDAIEAAEMAYCAEAEERQALEQEIEKLRRWKEEATIVLQRWDEVADLVPSDHVTLGSHKSYNVSRYIEWIQNENQALKDDLEHLQAYLDSIPGI